jgi:hypothetical protein
MPDSHDDNVRIGAEHEIAHALAYIFYGGRFSHVELDEVGCGQVVSEPWAARQDQIACIKMAGPAADFAYLADKNGEDAQIADAVDGWQYYLGLSHPADDEEAMRSDEAGALQMGLINYAFAWAAGFHMANRDLISELGDELQNDGGYLSYERVVAPAGDRIAGTGGPEMLRMFTKLEPYRAAIDEVHVHMADLRTSAA